jgi:hypothetical protein
MQRLTLADIQLRDPYVLPLAQRGEYFLFGSTDKNIWSGAGQGFDCYCSSDLIHWRGPIPAFRPPARFWGKTQFWAPEVHAWKGAYYMFATFKADGVRRGTAILRAARPEGPYRQHSKGAVTPRRWECLDGTLHIDAAGQPWIVFCHEWLQAKVGTICAQRLSPCLRRTLGKPVVLFGGDAAPWARQLNPSDPWVKGPGSYVTDGPFLRHAPNGSLIMVWSGFGKEGYTLGQARSASGSLLGPWTQVREPLFRRDGGHGMMFEDFQGGLYLTLHQPNVTPNERAHFVPIKPGRNGWKLDPSRPAIGPTKRSSAKRPKKAP